MGRRLLGGGGLVLSLAFFMAGILPLAVVQLMACSHCGYKGQGYRQAGHGAQPNSYPPCTMPVQGASALLALQLWMLVTPLQHQSAHKPLLLQRTEADCEDDAAAWESRPLLPRDGQHPQCSRAHAASTAAAMAASAPGAADGLGTRGLPPQALAEGLRARPGGGPSWVLNPLLERFLSPLRIPERGLPAAGEVALASWQGEQSERPAGMLMPLPPVPGGEGGARIAAAPSPTHSSAWAATPSSIEGEEAEQVRSWCLLGWRRKRFEEEGWGQVGGGGLSALSSLPLHTRILPGAAAFFDACSMHNLCTACMAVWPYCIAPRGARAHSTKQIIKYASANGFMAPPPLIGGAQDIWTDVPSMSDAMSDARSEASLASGRSWAWGEPDSAAAGATRQEPAAAAAAGSVDSGAPASTSADRPRGTSLHGQMPRGARKQLAAILDDFWGRVYDRHGAFVQGPAPSPRAAGAAAAPAAAAAATSAPAGLQYSFGAFWGSQHDPAAASSTPGDPAASPLLPSAAPQQPRSWPLSSPLQCTHTSGDLCCPWCSDLLLQEAQHCLEHLQALPEASSVLFPCGGGSSMRSNCGWSAGVLQQPAAVRHLHVIVALASGDTQQALATSSAPDPSSGAALEVQVAGPSGSSPGGGVPSCLTGRQQLGPAMVLSLGIWSLLTLLQWCQVRTLWAGLSQPLASGRAADVRASMRGLLAARLPLRMPRLTLVGPHAHGPLHCTSLLP